MRRYPVAITYESMTQPPQTTRHTVAAGSPAAAARRALAQTPALRHWSSVVILIDRDSLETPAEASQDKSDSPGIAAPPPPS